VDGTSSYGANGLHMTLESSERGWFKFSDNYKNIDVTCDEYHGELKPGETITKKIIKTGGVISWN